MAKPKRPALGAGITPAAPTSSLASVKPSANQPPAIHSASVAADGRGVGRPRVMHSTQRTFTMRLEADTMKHLSRVALERDTTAKAIFLEALDEWYRARGIAPIVSK